MGIRNHNIDVLKAIAIISVILLHSMSTEVLFLTGSPYHIWQTVPVFLILAGYNSANSYAKRQYESLSQLYNLSFLYKKIERLVYPFLLVWGIQVIVQFVLSDGINVFQIIFSLVSGGWGPGSYFVPIIIQATLLIPLIYLFCRKSLTFMTITLFVISLALDIACLLIDMPEGAYRLLIIRYVFALTLGVWLALNKSKVNYKWLVPLALISLVYITAVNYFDWIFIMEEYWFSQHAPSYFWVLLLVIVGLNTYNFKATNIFSKLMVRIGQASYHIFLMQMFYFWGVAEKLPEMHGILYLGVSVVVCLALGLCFFDFENGVRKIFKANLTNKSAAAKL